MRKWKELRLFLLLFCLEIIISTCNHYTLSYMNHAFMEWLKGNKTINYLAMQQHKHTSITTTNMCINFSSHNHFTIHMEKLHQDHRHLIWYNRKAQFQANNNNHKPAQCCHNFFQFPRAMLLLRLLCVLLSFHWKKLSHFFMLFVVAAFALSEI